MFHVRSSRYGRGLRHSSMVDNTMSELIKVHIYVKIDEILEIDSIIGTGDALVLVKDYKQVRWMLCPHKELASMLFPTS